MIGYKGIELRNGILRSKYNDIFELNVPTEPMEVDDGIAFTEAGYSFCGRIEQVVSHENILPALKHPASRDIRLFEIESIGDVVGSSYHYKSTQIIVKREITQAELITYLDRNVNAQEYIFKNITKEQFSAYKSLNIDDYRIITSEKDIEKTYVKSCARLGQADLCCQPDNGDWQLSLCDSCTGIDWYLNLKTYEPDYLYLKARAAILNGIHTSHIPEFNELQLLAKKNRKLRYECESLLRLETHLKIH